MCAFEDSSTFFFNVCLGTAENVLIYYFISCFFFSTTSRLIEERCDSGLNRQQTESGAVLPHFDVHKRTN